MGQRGPPLRLSMLGPLGALRADGPLRGRWQPAPRAEARDRSPALGIGVPGRAPHGGCRARRIFMSSVGQGTSSFAAVSTC